MRVRTGVGNGGVELAPLELVSETYPERNVSPGKEQLNCTAGTLFLGKPWL